MWAGIKGSPIMESAAAAGDVSGATIVDTPNAGRAGVLIVQTGPDAGKSFPLVEGANVIGRNPGVAVQLTDDAVSREHALAQHLDLGVPPLLKELLRLAKERIVRRPGHAPPIIASPERGTRSPSPPSVPSGSFEVWRCRRTGDAVVQCAG